MISQDDGQGIEFDLYLVSERLNFLKDYTQTEVNSAFYKLRMVEGFEHIRCLNG